jgi:Fic family protein
MTDLLGNWECFVHLHDDVPDLIRCALLHEQFEAIHPFLDGNGRVGRLFITHFLIERGRLSQPLLYLSAFIEAHRQEYYDLLQRVRTDCDGNAWIRFFLAGTTETARAAIQQAAALMDPRERLRGQLHDAPRALALVDALFVNPYLTAARAVELLAVSDPTARQAIRLLESTGLLEPVTARAWRRVYVARPILQALEQPPSEPTATNCSEDA